MTDQDMNHKWLEWLEMVSLGLSAEDEAGKAGRASGALQTASHIEVVCTASPVHLHREGQNISA